MISEAPDYLLMYLKEEEQLLHSRWLRSVNSAEYRTGVTAAKELILHHQVRFWVSDSRLLDNVLFADQQWIRREIAPLLHSSSLEKIARVLTEDVFNYISFENMVQHINEEYASPVELAQFSSLQAALDWLRME